MMKLSSRLRALCGMVPRGTAVFDVGCDHAYVPIALLQEGRCPFCVASDIRPGPLSAAESHVKEAGLADRIVLTLADGVPSDALLLFEKLKTSVCPGEGPSPDLTLLTAGMGGLMMLEILKNAAVPPGFFRYYLASPQRDADLFRTGLAGAGYRIVEEEMVEENGKFYPLILSTYVGNAAEPLSYEQALLGPELLKNGGPVYQRFLESRIRECEEILCRLPEGSRVRRAEVIRELQAFQNRA